MYDPTQVIQAQRPAQDGILLATAPPMELLILYKIRTGWRTSHSSLKSSNLVDELLGMGGGSSSKREPVAKRHHEVSGSLALLLE